LTTQEEITDSPTGWVNKHVRQYLSTDGKQGHRFYGHDALLITTIGRKSGIRRRTALYYGMDGDRYLVVASNGGSTTHPAWYLNLLEHPEIEVQVGAERFRAVARTATPEEKPPLWQKMVEVFPTYARYQKGNSRALPVIILERTDD
jgi:deazaflavin-dependent oxidoreductase (nitroreductase family)